MHDRTEMTQTIVPAQPGFNAIFVYTVDDEITGLMPIPIVAWTVRGQFDGYANRGEAKPIWVDFDWCLGDPLAIQFPTGEYLFPDETILGDPEEAIDFLQEMDRKEKAGQS